MTIYIPKNSSPVERNAAEELAQYLGKACGYEFPVLPEKDGETGIFVGFTDFAAARKIAAEGGRNSLGGTEAWVIRASDGSLVLTGGKKNTDRGILYAVEHYLEEVIGVRFWNALEEFVPAVENFAIAPELSLSGEPETEMRFPITCSYIGDDMRFCVRRRINNNGIPDAWGGCLTASPRGNCHTVDQIFPQGDLFESHPDWFAWSESLGKRVSYGQYCLNNEEFLQAFEKAFLDDIAKFYAEADAKGESRPHHFHISMNDTAFDCECPVCRERVAKSGGTGNVLRFVNRMARAAAKVYPEILVETLVYWTYMELPKDDTVPEKNVIVRLADLDIDILHSLYHPNNAHMMEVLEGWANLCKKAGNPLCIWDYNINARFSSIVPNTYRTAENFRIYKEYGIVGHFWEHEEPLLSDFWALKNWLLTHLMEDSTLDDRAMIDDFMYGYYGAAAPILLEWLELEEAVTATSMLRMCCVENFTKIDHIPYEVYVEGCRLFDEAELAVQYNEVLTRRVRQARTSLDVCILNRYDTLLYMAEQRGTVFPVARETAALRYALTVAQTQGQTEDYRKVHPGAGIPNWEGTTPLLHWQAKHVPLTLPEEFTGTKTLQVPMGDYVTQEALSRGMVYERDPDAGNGFSARLQLDRAPDFIRDVCVMRHRDDDGPQFTMTLRHHGEIRKRIFSLEDVRPDEYTLYHLFDVDDLSEESNTLLNLTRSSFNPHISGFAQVLGTGKVSIWARIKFSGAVYGGSTEATDAIWFDRLFFVPRD